MAKLLKAVETTATVTSWREEEEGVESGEEGGWEGEDEGGVGGGGGGGGGLMKAGEGIEGKKVRMFCWAQEGERSWRR